MKNLELLKKLEEDFNLYRNKKKKLITDLLSDLEPIIEIFYNIIGFRHDNKDEINFNQTYLDLGLSKYDLNNVRSKFYKSFPGLTYDNDYCLDTIYPNYKWEVKDFSNQDYVYITFNPLEEYPRMPMDPEENPSYFEYKVKRDVHEKLLVADKEEKRKIIIEYLKDEMTDFLAKKVEESKIETRSKLDKIDFNNPIILEEIKKRIK